MCEYREIRMQIDTLKLINNLWQRDKVHISDPSQAQLVYIFGTTAIFKQERYFHTLQKMYPNAMIIGCSTSANILGIELVDVPLVASAVQFSSAWVKMAHFDFNSGDNIESLSAQLVEQLDDPKLKHIFVLSDGLLINGSELVRGINKASKVPISGGLAGDGDRFQETWVIANQAPRQCCVVAVGFYGEKLVISSGCYGGWSEFGTERLITRSKQNVLYEIDNEPVLQLYKRYLGQYASDLPHSGLRFPLSIWSKEGELPVIRTLLSIDETEQSITFAGDVPEGYQARLMQPNIDILIDGAGIAAQQIKTLTDHSGLGLVVSCIGRKIVLSQLVEEELEAVAEILGDQVQLVGYYSYGEIAPFEDHIKECKLHNQTMTLTVIYEENE